MSAEFESPPHRPLSPVVGGEGKGEGPAPAEPALVTRTYDLLLWLIQHVGKFPKSHRYVLGERMETRMNKNPFVLSSSICQPFVLRLSKETVGILGGGWTKPRALRPCEFQVS